MTDYYLDSSATVKRYAQETGTAWVVSITDPTAENSILISEITVAEVAAALAAKHRVPRGISRPERDRALSLFLRECRDRFMLLKVDRRVIDLAVELTQRLPLRGYDAVQLATARLANQDLMASGLPPLVFVSADNDLIAAAQTEGLNTENANLYP